MKKSWRYIASVLGKGLFLVALLTLSLSWPVQVMAETRLTATSIERIELYRTSKNDVQSWFGPPAAVHKIGDEELLVYKTSKKDPVMGRDFCDLVTITVNRAGKVTDVVYKKYCELP